MMAMFSITPKTFNPSDDPRSWMPEELWEDYGEMKKCGFTTKVAIDHIITNIQLYDRTFDPYPLHPMIAPKMRVMMTVAHMMYCSVGEIIGNERKRRISLARGAVALSLRKRNPEAYAYPAIGALLRKDHASAIHSKRVAEALEQRDAWFARVIQRGVEA